MKKQTTDGFTNFNLSIKVPVAKAALLENALKGVLALAEHSLRPLNEHGEKMLSVAEVFPERTPGMLIRGLRGKNEMTQEELAGKLGIAQTRVSELESGKRSVSLAMAKRLASVFSVTHKMFL